MVAKRSMDRFANAIYQVEDLTAELDSIELALNEEDPDLLLDFKRIYTERGGSQFRPVEKLVQCED